MKWNELFSVRISELITKQLKQSPNKIQLLKEEAFISQQISQWINADFQREKELNREVNKMLEDFENQGHSFERRKMYPMLKKQLAKKKGIIL